MPGNKNPLTNFFFELGMMKKIAHSGTKFAGVRHPDTLGEHTCRAAQIGFCLAATQNANAEKVATMCLMHDIGEIRIGDAHKIAQRYLDIRPAEMRAVQEQTEDLPRPLRERIRGVFQEFSEQKTPESKIARDADLLETILQAKEYLDTGHKAAKRWLSNGSKHLRTDLAKKLFAEIKKTQFTDWWDHLN
ncbi:MAG: HD family hydrolase [Patescibacteria group bacterium]